MIWKVIDTGASDAAKNMAIDYALLQELPSMGVPILHLYEWARPSATHGYFINPYQHLKEGAVRKHGLQLAKRPTGGGVLFHLTDFAFSILIPSNHPAYSTNTLENYAFVNRMVAIVIKNILGTGCQLLVEEGADPSNFCMAKPTKYDVMINGKKAAGAAQRRTKGGFLHQGSISISLPPEDFLFDILKDHKVIESMLKNTFCFANKEVKQTLKEQILVVINDF